MKDKTILLDTETLKCKDGFYNKIEVDNWKKVFLKKKPIPCPVINGKKEVIAWQNCYFAMKEIGISKMHCIVAKAL